MTTEDHKRKAILLQFFRIQSIEKKRIKEFQKLYAHYCIATSLQRKEAIGQIEEQLISLEYKIGILKMRKRMLLSKIGANNYLYVIQN